jgi:ubiquinone/menaquinone biosynthesis C-methylase UbiE
MRKGAILAGSLLLALPLLQPVRALQEMCRVLNPGGKALIIDLRGNASREEIGREVDCLGLSLMNRTITRLVLQTRLLKRTYTTAQFGQMLKQTSFHSFEFVESGIGLEVRLVK